MSLDISILYRGDLSSCNYSCSYCPFAKKRETKEELESDRRGLERFNRWLATRTRDRIRVFFTPWGEALVRPWYRRIMIALSRMAHVEKVAVQTNLSCPLDWIADGIVSKFGFWCTYHPSQTTQKRFLAKCRQLDSLGVRYSVGAVGRRDDFDRIAQLRTLLPDRVYLWINAYESGSHSTSLDCYDRGLIEGFTQIDPLFPLSLVDHASRGRACRTGESVISLDGVGNVRRCHFVSERLGNIYASPLESMLKPRPCPAATCNCHIGYAHLEHLKLDELFGDGILERVPPAGISGAHNPASDSVNDFHRGRV